MFKTLEDYIVFLGEIALIVSHMKERQKDAMRSGILDIDEEEQCETINYISEKLLTALDDQLSLVKSRSAEDWETLRKRIKNKLRRESYGNSEKVKREISSETPDPNTMQEYSI